MNKKINVRKLTMTAMLSGIAFVLMYLEFPIPFMPTFIKMDLSDLPALIGAFSMGPISGALIEIVKNLLHLMATSSFGVGELSNCLLGMCFVIPAGAIYQHKKSRKNALIGSLVGAVIMAGLSIVLNYFLVYPIYTNFMSMEAIIGAYKAILPACNTLLKALVIFNMPFTFVKGMINVILTFLIYKHISPLIHGTNQH